MDILPQRPKSRAPRMAVWITTCLVLSGLLVPGLDAYSTWLGDALALDGPRDGMAFAQEVPTSTVTPQPDPSPTPEPPPPSPPPPPPPSNPSLPDGSGDGRRVVYSNSQQRVWLVEDSGQVSASWLVSGRKGTPRAGTYKVFSKSRYSSARGGRV
ncbi:MAG TPA: L,D-transpeptidase, partial [Actinomycetota bacterium]|nr:L,D-transpeptidase [Actinomycetota bacterium]